MKDYNYHRIKLNMYKKKYLIYLNIAKIIIIYYCLKMLGLYRYTLIISHKSGIMLNIPNK